MENHMGAPEEDDNQQRHEVEDDRGAHLVQSDGGSDDVILGGAGVPRRKREY